MTARWTGSLCSTSILLAASLLGDLKQVTSHLYASVFHLQNVDSSSACLYTALHKLLTKSTIHQPCAAVTETLHL